MVRKGPLSISKKQLLTSLNYFASTLVNPGLSTVICPAQTQVVLLDSNIAGIPPIFNFLATGAQGATVIGMQEEGTKTGTGPAIFQFIGLAGDLHCPKAGTFSIGTKSICAAIAFEPAVITRAIGNTTMSFGPAPKEHFNLAPIQTHLGMLYKNLNY